MIDPNAWRYWYFWRRILLFLAGVAGLAGQMLAVTASQAQYLAFGVAVINLALSLIPDAAVDKVMPVDRYSDYRKQAPHASDDRMQRAGQARGDSGQVN